MNFQRKRCDNSHDANRPAGLESYFTARSATLKLSRGICALLLLLIFAASMQAATTLSQYRERIRQVVALLDGLAAANEGEMGTSMVLGHVRSLLPARDTVEAGTGEVQVDNAWLHAALSDYEKTPAGTQRAEILRRTTEQLQALGLRVAELQDSKPTAASSSQNKERLAEILRRSEYQKKQAEGSALARLWQRIMKWLNNLFPKAQPMSPESATTVSTGAQYFVVLVALAVLAYVIWKLAPRLFVRRKAKKKEKQKARIVLGERLEPDQTAGDLLSQAEALARAGDLRAAIRKGYIALLCELGDQKIIRLAQHKTNRDYLSAVRQIPPLHDEMRKLTNSFESHWYGFEPATETEWHTFRSGYQKALAANR